MNEGGFAPASANASPRKLFAHPLIFSRSVLPSGAEGEAFNRSDVSPTVLSEGVGVDPLRLKPCRDGLLSVPQNIRGARRSEDPVLTELEELLIRRALGIAFGAFAPAQQSSTFSDSKFPAKRRS